MTQQLPPGRPHTWVKPETGLFITVCVAVVVILLSQKDFRDGRLRWLVEHEILVAAAEHPIWMLPGEIGGLDLRRLIVLACVLTIIGAYLVSGLWHLRRRLPQLRLIRGDWASRP
ncbi:hypothetical protein [Nocardia sp. IFM 10818]